MAVLVSCCTGLGLGAATSDSGEDTAAPKAPRETVTVTITVTVTVTPSPAAPSLRPFAATTAPVPAAKPPPARKPAPPKPAAPKPAPVEEPEPAAYYANCAAARAAGAAPLHRGDPGYRSGLDRDGDGVACES